MYKDECKRNKSYVDYFPEHTTFNITRPGFLKIASNVDLSSETADENQEILLGSYNDVNYIAIIRLPYFYAIYTKTYINLIVVFQTNSHIRNKI